MILVELGVNNQYILAKTIDFSLLVPIKSSVESSINDDVYQKKVSKVPWYAAQIILMFM